MKVKQCIMCGNESNGIILKGRIICLDCERDIVYNNVQSECYERHIKKIREILFK